jgi:hypothetical protein
MIDKSIHNHPSEQFRNKDHGMVAVHVEAQGMKPDGL